MFASADADERIMAPVGTRTGSEGALGSTATVGHDGERQFLVHPESRKATGGPWAWTGSAVEERQA